MDPMTAPLGEVLDWLRERDGYTRGGVYGWIDKAGHPCGEPDVALDRLAGMLLEGWCWEIRQLRESLWFALAWTRGDGNDVDATSTTELEARARVVAAVLGREGK